MSKSNPDLFNPINSTPGVDWWRLNAITKIERAVKEFNAGSSEHRTARDLARALYDTIHADVANSLTAAALARSVHASTTEKEDNA